MDLNRILIWIVCLSCGINLIQTLKVFHKVPRAAIGIPLGVLMLTAIASFLRPDLGGLIGGFAWTCLLLMPTLVFQQVSSFIAQQHFKQAHQWAQCFKWVYGWYGMKEVPSLIKAVDLTSKGYFKQANEILDQYKQTKSAVGWMAITEIYRQQGGWSDLLKWIQDHGLGPSLLSAPNLVIYYLRALGETGRLNTLVQEFSHLTPVLEQTEANHLALGQLMVLVFCGYSDQVRQLFLGPLATFPLSIQIFWVATAELVLGLKGSAYEQLQALRGSNRALSQAIDLRLSHPLADPKTLTPEARAYLNSLELSSTPQSLAVLLPLPGENPYLTYSLMSLNGLVFSLELLLGGSENVNVLFLLGALVPEAVIAGDWWRLGTATLLHFGWTHLGMNMMGLLFLGPFVERGLGVLPYLGVYWGSGMGSMLSITWLWHQGVTASDFVVGASGSIMGLIGSTAVILLSVWYREKSQAALRQLRSIFLIIALQIVFDLTTPQISFIGHLSGLLIGAALTGLWLSFGGDPLALRLKSFPAHRSPQIRR